MSIRPVSYTHLDVYKRQEHTCAGRKLLGKDQKETSDNRVTDSRVIRSVLIRGGGANSKTFREGSRLTYQEQRVR